MTRLSGFLMALILVGAACEGSPEGARVGNQSNGTEAAGPGESGSFLFAWAGDQDGADSDFLAVFDADPTSEAYGEVVATLPVGDRGTGPHHVEHVMPVGGVLFANGFDAGRTFLIDLNDPARPRLAGSFEGAGDLTYPHSFERLPNGNVLATFQTEGEGNAHEGGLAEIDRHGEVVRTASASDPAAGDYIRPYSLAPLPELDRVVSTSTDMRSVEESHAVQVWRLSDLELLTTLRLPDGERGTEGRYPGEPRTLEDGRTVLVGTFSCGLFRLTSLDTDKPRAELVHAFSYGEGDGAPRGGGQWPPHQCALSARVGHFWVQTVPAIFGLVSLDVSDPAHPVEADRLELGEGRWPHWIAPDHEGRRLALTGYADLDGLVLIVNVDPETGALTLDEAFRDPGSAEPGVTMLREEWPHGATGPAIPHGAVFSR